MTQFPFKHLEIEKLMFQIGGKPFTVVETRFF